MRNFFFKSFLIALFIAPYTTLFSIIIPIPLEERISHTEQIALAKLLDQYTYWDAEKKNIYTSNRFEVAAYLKEKSTQQYIYITTLGGVVGDEAQMVFPNIPMEIGTEYCLFLTSAKAAQIPYQVLRSGQELGTYFQPYSYVQGVLPLKNGQYLDQFSKSNYTELTLLDKIYHQVQFSPAKPNGSAFRPRTHEENSLFTTNRSTLILKNGVGENTTTFYAGTTDIEKEMIIHGTGFGNQVGFVQFANSDTGGSDKTLLTYSTDIIYWKDNEIRLKVPTSAGTGIMEVKNASGVVVGNINITIHWSISSIYSSYKGFETETRQTSKLLDVNNSGGYTILLNSTSGFSNDMNAVNAFERALEVWQCETGVNWELDKSGVTNSLDKDDLCVIQYSTTLPLGVLGLTTTRYRALGSTKCNQRNTLWSVKEFDIELVHPSNMYQNYEWNFLERLPSTFQFDFQSIVLHELGHALGLGHVNHEDHAMYFSITNGQHRRHIGEGEKAAGHYKVDLSMISNCITTPPSMKPYSLNCSTSEENITATPPATVSAQIKLLLEGFFNTSTGDLKTYLSEENLLPVDQPFSGSPFFYLGTEKLGTTSPDIVDWLLIQLRDVEDRNNIVHQKAVLLRKDGFIVNEKGETLVEFGLSTTDSFYIAVYHRSHLPVISNIPHLFSTDRGIYDFTLSESAALGDAQLKYISSKFLLNAGDFDGNGIINNQDFNIWKQSSAAIRVYLPSDADGNGIINNQDYNLWRANRSKVSVLKE